VLGPEHPAVAHALHNVAMLYQVQGKYEQAELLYRRVLHIQEKVLGTEHPETMEVRKDYDELLRKKQSG